jgi:hypothetical protein
MGRYDDKESAIKLVAVRANGRFYRANRELGRMFMRA